MCVCRARDQTRRTGWDFKCVPCAGVFPLASEKRPLLMCEAAGGAATVLMRGAGLEGTEAEEAVLPEWIVDVACGTYKARTVEVVLAVSSRPGGPPIHTRHVFARLKA